MDQGCCTDQEWKGVWDPFVRLCYQFGMLLGVDEFNQELGYGLCKHRLSQRLFVGYGLVWGKDFVVDDVAGTLTVGPLFALDELGRELYLKDPCTIDLAQWLDDNGLDAGGTLYLTIAYQACGVAPVPAVAAPCDDAASPTMMSRVLESVQCALGTDVPDAPIDLSSNAPTPPDTATQAVRFATLLQLIRDDAPRPLLIGTITTKAADAGSGKKTLTSGQIHNPALPRLDIAGAVALRVVGIGFSVDSGGKPQLDVTFTGAPTVATLESFDVALVTPGAAGQLGAVATLVSTAGGVAVSVDAANPKILHVPLSAAPTTGQSYLVTIAGTGPDAVLALTPQGPIALGDGNDFTYAAVQG